MSCTQSRLSVPSSDQKLQSINTQITLQVNAIVVYNHTTGNTDVIKDKDSENFIFSALFGWAIQTGVFLLDLTEKESLYESTARDNLVGNLTLLGKATDVR